MEKRLSAILRLAIKYKATDIHFNHKNSDMQIEIRINDRLYKIKAQRNDYKLIRYLQYLSNLDIGNITKPQTGQFEMIIDGTLLSLRFAVINSYNNSNGVLRILNSRLKIEADKLSTLEKQNQYFKSLMHKDSGLIIFSGATGSGKTTTLYSLLKTARNEKIFTIEDPVEIYNDSFVQLSVNESTGFDYAEGIKQILRHDPDIIMIGEIRDEKAAKMAVVAANTGHLVLTSIHSSKASSTISRLIELGVNEEHLYEVLLCISNQKMLSNSTGEKRVIYEIMDKDEIDYFRQNKKNSSNFVSINSQLAKNINDGFFV